MIEEIFMPVADLTCWTVGWLHFRRSKLKAQSSKQARIFRSPTSKNPGKTETWSLGFGASARRPHPRRSLPYDLRLNTDQMLAVPSPRGLVITHKSYGWTPGLFCLREKTAGSCPEGTIENSPAFQR